MRTALWSFTCGAVLVTLLGLMPPVQAEVPCRFIGTWRSANNDTLKLEAPPSGMNPLIAQGFAEVTLGAMAIRGGWSIESNNILAIRGEDTRKQYHELFLVITEDHLPQSFTVKPDPSKGQTLVWTRTGGSGCGR